MIVVLKGRTRIYQYSSNTWSQLGQDLVGDDDGDHSGRSVSLNADGTFLLLVLINFFMMLLKVEQEFINILLIHGYN